MTWLVVLAVLGVAAWLLMRNTEASAAPAPTFTARTEGHIRGPGDFDYDVVGESHYQHNIERIAGGRSSQSANKACKATLLLDDGNAHDKNAVKVYIDGMVVGHLDREMAKSWRPQLRKQGLPVGNYTCDALVVGGWDKGGGDAGHFGVKLDLPVDD